MRTQAVADLLVEVAQAICAGTPDLSFREWEMLRLLGRAGDVNHTAAGLSVPVEADVVAIAAIAASLVQKGYLDDPRCAEAVAIGRLKLNAAGQRVIEKDPVDRVLRSIQSLSPSAQSDLGRAVQQIYEFLKAEGAAAET